MKAVLKGKIKSLTEHEHKGDSFVSVHLQLEGRVESANGPDAKKAHADMYLYIKPVAAEVLKFGQELVIVVEDSPPPNVKVIYCYHCGQKLDRKGPRDCPACG